MKRKHNDKTTQYTPSPPNRKDGYIWFACNSCNRTKNKVKVHTNTVYASVKKIFPKETPKRPIQCFKCTECNSAFYARHKLKKHTREQHEGKFVKSPERKSPRTESKTKGVYNITRPPETLKCSKSKM